MRYIAEIRPILARAVEATCTSDNHLDEGSIKLTTNTGYECCVGDFRLAMDACLFV